MFKSIKTDPFLLIPMFVAGVFLSAAFVVVLALVNSVLGTQTVIETWPGTKSVCSRQQFNYSLKVTQCVEHITVSAVCKKIEHTGPIFDTFTNSTCE